MHVHYFSRNLLISYKKKVQTMNLGGNRQGEALKEWQKNATKEEEALVMAEMCDLSIMKSNYQLLPLVHQASSMLTL